MSSNTGSTRNVTLLFTCVGRRVELLQSFRAAAQRLNISLRIIGTDRDMTAPALQGVDEPVLMPPVRDAEYMPKLLELVRRRRPTALIPTTDTDLPAISAQRSDVDALGCVAMIADSEVIANCRDKLQTYRFLKSHGIDTPATFTPEELHRQPVLSFPVFAKPLCGSASERAQKLDSQRDLDYFAQRYSDLIVQELVTGQEYTLDVYVGLTGRPRCVVPRARWQVRTGEVVKGVVVKDREIMQAGLRVAEALGPSPRGLITLQCIVTPARRICFVEINPRFGGGAPMSMAAGADFPGWLLQELLGRQPAIAFDGFRHGLCMLRFDWSTFVQLDDDLQPKIGTPLRPWPRFE